MHVKTVNEKPYHSTGSTGNIFTVHPPLRTLNGTARLRYMIGGVLGVCQLVCQATAVAQVHVHVILRCLKSKACNESKDVNMDIMPLGNWQNYRKR